MASESNGSDLISQLEAWLPKGQHYPAGLYLVATPIGNLADITLRALYVLQHSDVILCEDTRVTRTLLSAYGITTRTMAYHDHNAATMLPTVLEQVRAGKRVALVSDAGTPLVNDPGFGLVKAMQEAGLYVTSIPGASSPLIAITLAGLPTDRFLFAGFLPSKAKARETAIAELAAMASTLVLLEAPHRLDDSLKALAGGMGEKREAAVLRELTKRHEEVRGGTLGELAAHYAEAGNPKGEIVLVIAPPQQTEAMSEETIDAMLTKALKHSSVKEASTEIAAATGLPRKEIYARALEMKDRA